MKLKNIISQQNIKVGDKNIKIFGVNSKTGIGTTKDVSKNISNYKIIKKNYFAYNPYRVNIGSIGLFKGDLGGVSPAYVVFTVDENIINPDFLFIFLKSSLGNTEINKYTYGAVRKSLGYKNLGNIEIPDLSLEEQNNFLKLYKNLKINYDKFEDINNQNQNYVKLLKQSILQEAIEGKLTKTWREKNKDIEPASVFLERIKAEKEELIKQKKLKKQKKLDPIGEDEIPFEIPENWIWGKLGNILLKLTDGTHHSPINMDTGEYKYISAKNIKSNGIDLTKITYVDKETHNEIYARCNPEKGDILYIKDGGTTGVVAINNLNEEFSMLSSVALFKLPKFVDNKYLYYILSSPFYYDYIRNDMSGAAITRVTLTKLSNSILPLPPLEEQKEIVKKVDELMKLCDELEKQTLQAKENSENLMKAVLQEVFDK